MPPVCPLCNSGTPESVTLGLFVLESVEFSVWKCGNCKVYFTWPQKFRVNETLPLDQSVTNYSFWTRWLLKKIYRMRLKRTGFPVHFNNDQSIADIGGGMGGFLEQVDTSNKILVEPNLTEEKKIQGLRIFSQLFSTNNLSALKKMQPDVDYITSWHSLEHFENPADGLRAMYDWLKPGGWLYISVPNIESLQAVMGGRRWTYLDVPLHLFHFTQRGLSGMLKKEGFEIICQKTWCSDYELFGFVQTMLNFLCLDHNAFYKQSKKASKKNLWATVSTIIFGIPILIISSILSLVAFVVKKPSVIEFVARKPETV